MSGDKGIVDDVQAAVGLVASAVGRAILAVDALVADLLRHAEALAASGTSTSRYDGVGWAWTRAVPAGSG